MNKAIAYASENDLAHGGAIFLHQHDDGFMMVLSHGRDIWLPITTSSLGAVVKALQAAVEGRSASAWFRTGVATLAHVRTRASKSDTIDVAVGKIGVGLLSARFRFSAATVGRFLEKIDVAELTNAA